MLFRIRSNPFLSTSSMKNFALSLAVVILACGAVFGQAQYKVLYNFGAEGFLDTGGSLDGGAPNQGLVFDRAGNIFGTTAEGGTTICNTGYGCGTIFELIPTSNGGWIQTVLYSFCASTGDPYTCPDGAYPQNGLTIDAAGNLYGTSELYHIRAPSSSCRRPLFLAAIGPKLSCGLPWALANLTVP
jgi:hypothetical protein